MAKDQSKVRRPRVRGFSKMSDYLNLHDRAPRKGSYLDGGAGRKIAGEILGVKLVDSREVRQIREKHSGLHHVPKRELLVLEYDLNFLQHAFGFRFDAPRYQVSRSGIERDLARAKKQVSD